MELSKKLWSVGGGKGGIGKSVFTLGLGISLSRMGKKIILVDADLGGANLHTLMGVRFPPCTLEDFLLNRVERLEDIVIDTQVEGIGLICGADDILGAANPTYTQKVRILKQIENLPADLVFLDLGAGTSYNILDFFNYSQGRICIMTNQATSLQNVYGFIKSALYRQITREFAKDHDVLRMVLQTETAPSESKIESVKELLLQLQEGGEDRLDRFSQLLKTFELFLVVNMVKEDADLQAARIIEKVCGSFLSVVPQVLGHLSYDPAIEKAVNQMVPFPLNRENSPAALDLKEIAQIVLANCYNRTDPGEGVEKRATSFLGALQSAASKMNKT
ncbi:MAG TPA: P-loop NTPase [Desulfobaccales bacterium]|nr:P-loop NTPase [Desulfobaccales bacterium]